MLFRIYAAAIRRLWYITNRPQFKYLGRKVLIKKSIFLSPFCISIFDNVFIHCNARIEGIKNYEGISFSPNIIIGQACSIQQNLHLTCANEVVIGKNTAIAANVTITDIHHPYEDINKPIEQQAIKVSSVFIGEDCKIYNNVVILPGANIGKHCTIGANSVVSGIIPDYCVAVGIPARIIKRYNFSTKQWEKTDKYGNFLN